MLNLICPCALVGRSAVVPTGICIADVVSTISMLPSNVKFALSSIAPLVPASTTLPAVKSLTIALANVVSPVTPSVVEIVCAPVSASVVPSNAKFALSSIAPAVPDSTTLLAVKSLTIALANVASPPTFRFSAMPVPPSTINAPVVALVELATLLRLCCQ